jgi:purine-binding chemotaxis protein CheW
MVDEPTDIIQEQMQCVTFILEDETYGINVMQAQEVLRETEVPPVPGSPDYVMGIINLRNNKLLILVDLNKLLSEAEWGKIAEQ